MKGYAIAALVIGILFILAGSVFAFQGAGMIGGSVMTNNPFWIYAGSGIALLGIVIAAVGGWAGARSARPKPVVPQ